MAEARSAVSYHHEAPSNLSFSITNDEIVLRISKNVFPSFITSIRRSLERRLLRARNIVVNALYPQPPWQIGALVAAPGVIMLSDMPRLQPAHDFLWSLERFIPTAPWMPQLGRVGRATLIATALGTGTVLALSYLRNLGLRLLLSYQGWIYESKPSTTTKIWSVLVRIFSGSHRLRLVQQRPLLYANQKALPTLPVPPLESTCKRFMASVKPVLSKEEYETMERLCIQFSRNEGPKLQRYCMLKSLISPNYVADWWEKYVYLRGRDPIVINSNYYILDSKREHVRTHSSARLCRPHAPLGTHTRPSCARRQHDLRVHARQGPP